jgi:TM2 domain-containing membrane protein YozV
MSTPQPVYIRPSQPQKDLGLAYLLWALTFVLVAGIQHFYLGKPIKGVIWLLTWGLFGIGTLVDLFTLPRQVIAINERMSHIYTH